MTSLTNKDVIIRCVEKMFEGARHIQVENDNTTWNWKGSPDKTLTSLQSHTTLRGIFGTNLFLFVLNGVILRFPQEMPWAKVKKLLLELDELCHCPICFKSQGVLFGCPQCLKTCCIECAMQFCKDGYGVRIYVCPLCRYESDISCDPQNGGSSIMVFNTNA